MMKTDPLKLLEILDRAASMAPLVRNDQIGVINAHNALKEWIVAKLAAEVEPKKPAK